jgi:hypothetical protein
MQTAAPRSTMRETQRLLIAYWRGMPGSAVFQQMA